MPARKIGYALSQEKTSVSHRALPTSLDRLFVEKRIKKNAKRPQLQACLEFVTKGDQLIVESMNALADNPLELIRTIKNFTDRGVSVTCYQEGRVFSVGEDPIAMLTAVIASGFPERGRQNIKHKETSNETDLKKAAKRKIKTVLSTEQVHELKRRARAGENKTVLAKDFSISREALHKYLK